MRVLSKEKLRNNAGFKNNLQTMPKYDRFIKTKKNYK